MLPPSLLLLNLFKILIQHDNYIIIIIIIVIILIRRLKLL